MVEKIAKAGEAHGERPWAATFRRRGTDVGIWFVAADAARFRRVVQHVPAHSRRRTLREPRFISGTYELYNPAYGRCPRLTDGQLSLTADAQMGACRD